MLRIVITLTLLLSKRSQATFGVCLENIIKQSSIYNAVIQSPKRTIDVPLEIASNYVSSENVPSLGLPKKMPKSFTVTYDNILEFEKTVLSISRLNFSWDTTRNKLIIIANVRDDLPKLVGILWKYRFYKSMILLETEIYQIDFENIKCGTEIRYRRIGKCAEKTSNNLELFSHDMKRYFENCPLRVIWSRSEPWVIDVTSTSEPGIFVEFLDVVKQGSRLNVTFSPKNDDYFKELIETYRFDTLLEDFDSGNADLYVYIGSYYMQLRASYIKVITNNLYIIAPKPQQLAYWKAVYLIYSLPSWIALIASYFIVSFMVYFLSRKSDERSFQSGSLMLYVLSMTLGIGYHKTPKLSGLRIMAGSYLVFGFITSAITQGKLYSFISKPMYQKPIRNVEDLLNSGIRVKSQATTKRSFMFVNELYDELLRKIEPINSSLSLLNIANEAYEDQFATITDEGVFILQPSLKENMQYFDHMRYMTTFYMPINHVLYECINDMIQRMVETGILEALISKWRSIYNIRNRMEETQIETSFTLTQLEPAIFVLVLGYAAAFIVFISEYFLYYLPCVS